MSIEYVVTFRGNWSPDFFISNEEWGASPPAEIKQWGQRNRPEDEFKLKVSLFGIKKSLISRLCIVNNS